MIPLVGLIDQRDTWHHDSVALKDALKDVQAQLIYFDCVINETISVLARRAKERGQSEAFATLSDRLAKQVPKDAVTWVSGETQRLYSEILDWLQSTAGDLNFHDALIALNCRDLGIELIASFDRDFDQIPWLTRIADSNAVLQELGVPAQEKQEDQQAEVDEQDEKN